MNDVVGVRLALSAGADPNRKAYLGLTLAGSAAFLYCFDIPGDGVPPDGQECDPRSSVAVLDALLDGGADPDAGGKVDVEYAWIALSINRRTSTYGSPLNTEGLPQEGPVPPLVAASISGNYAGIERLLAAGANPSRPAFGKVSPLWAAVVASDRQAVRLLLAAGADPTPEVDRAYRPIDTARHSGEYGILDDLLAAN